MNPPKSNEPVLFLARMFYDSGDARTGFVESGSWVCVARLRPSDAHEILESLRYLESSPAHIRVGELLLDRSDFRLVHGRLVGVTYPDDGWYVPETVTHGFDNDASVSDWTIVTRNRCHAVFDAGGLSAGIEHSRIEIGGPGYEVLTRVAEGKLVSLPSATLELLKRDDE